MSRRAAGALGALLGLAGCAVGPDFARPAPPPAQAYDTPEPGAPQPSPALRPAAGADVPGQWWQLFKSPALDSVMRLAIADSPSLSAAEATLAAAREAVLVAQSGSYPKLGAAAGAERSKGTPAGAEGGGSAAAPGILDSYSVGLTASYTLDAFGGTRRLVEQQEALAELQRYQLAAAYLTLTGNVATEAVAIASARLQIATTLDLIEDDQQNLALTRRAFEIGTAAETDVLTAESQLAADQATLPSLRQQLSAARHALAILVGRTPGAWSAPELEIADLALPAALPLSLPSALARQRPDILAAEAQLHADSAAIGVALAQEYPSLTLSAALTRESLAAADPFHQFDTLWNVGGALAQPIFQGGALTAQTRAARDTFTAQAATYRQVVLTAFAQVADDLRALQHDGERVAAYDRAVRVATEALVLQRASYAAGKTNVLQLIDAERSAAQARLGSGGAEAEQLQDAVQLFVALGGGWWNTKIAASD